MVNHDGLAIAAHGVGDGHEAIGRGDDLCTVAGTDIDATVERAFTIEWIDAFSKTSGDLAFDGPEIGSGIRLDPVGGRNVAGKAHGQAYHGRATQSRGPQGMQLI